MKVRNTAAGRQGVYTSSGLIYLNPGEERRDLRFTPAQIARARRIKFLSVVDDEPKVEAKAAPVIPAVVVNDPALPEADDLDGLRKEAEALGVDVDGRWGEKRLRAEIQKARG